MNLSVPLKLVDGPTYGEGRVMVYDELSASWGSVCADGWNEAAADLVCKKLGFLQGLHQGIYIL